MLTVSDLLVIMTMDHKILVKTSKVAVFSTAYNENDHAAVFQTLDIIFVESNDCTYDFTRMRTLLPISYTI